MDTETYSAFHAATILERFKVFLMVLDFHFLHGIMHCYYL